MKKLTLLFILSLSLSFLYAKEITISVGAGQHWKEKREPQFSVWLEDSDGKLYKNFICNRTCKSQKLDDESKGRKTGISSCMVSFVKA